GAGAVCGAVAVSRTTESVLAALDRIRVDLFRIVLLSIFAAGLVVFVLARGLVRPLGRLRDAADEVLARSRSRGAAFPGAARPDEIGDLARALGGLDERLERRLDELEAFASDVAHEVKNPLAAMRSAAELLRESKDQGEIRQLTGLIANEVGRIDAVVGSLQEVARLDAGRDAGSPPSALRLDVLAERVAGGWRERAPVGVALEVQLAGPVLVSIGEESAARVIENLLENAVSFTPVGGVVRLALEVEAGHCVLTVDDSGPGVPAEHRARIFERFFSWRPQEAARAHLGLGLGIARAIVERHGGTIALAPESALGGARLVVRWPIAGRR
ncbi:MAG: ATP-binding protein, partial [Thermoanaerobaculia bacterium]